MVSFRQLASIAITGLAVPTLAASTPAQVVDNLKALKAKSQALIAPTQSLNVVNGPLIIANQGPFPSILDELRDITSTGYTFISQMDGMAAVPAGTDADAIFSAFDDFGSTHLSFLSLLIGKSGLFNDVPAIGGPVVTALRGNDDMIATFAYTLSENVKSRSADILTKKQYLDQSFSYAEQEYEGLVLGGRAAPAPVSRVKRAAIAA